MRASVFLAIPHYGDVCAGLLASIPHASQSHQIKVVTSCASLLAHNFNILWCEALNTREERKWTHWCLHHSDIHPQGAWLDVMLGEMDRVGADVISALVPIKDLRGLTSTGVQDPNTLAIRRLTMKEVWSLPMTFDAAGAGFPDRILMVNTGLLLCRFDAPWVEEAYFEVRDHVVRDEKGLFHANVLPEDWNFSNWCHRRGLKVFATRAVPVRHWGHAAYANESPWGTWSYDEQDRSCADDGRMLTNGHPEHASRAEVRGGHLGLDAPNRAGLSPVGSPESLVSG